MLKNWPRLPCMRPCGPLPGGRFLFGSPSGGRMLRRDATFRFGSVVAAAVATPAQNNGSDSIIDVELHEEAKRAYLNYSLSVMKGRALPDVRDGLKPVHRRILFSMYELGLAHGKPFRKSARVVGEVLGKYHPHGDTAIYDALVRMAQPFVMRECLINGHGNFGSIDDDPAAAMRYTECRLQEVSEDMLLSDLAPSIVPFTSNFDESCDEPTVLPARLPQLLINGAQGIAVGLATRIPPHNMVEVTAAMKALLADPGISNEALLQHVRGPDFPTGGEVLQSPGLTKMYTEGKGSITVRCKLHVEEGRRGRDVIVVTQLPYQVSKAAVVQEIAELVEKGTLTGVADIQDESDRRGLRVAIEVKRGSEPSVVVNQLLQHSRLQIRYASNLVALVDGVPRQLTLRDALQEFVGFRIQVVTQRAESKLHQHRTRLHIVEGFLTAADALDEVVLAIRSAADGKQAKVKLRETWQLSDAQADAVLNLSLRRLTALAIEELRNEQESLIEAIADLQGLLGSREKIVALIKREADALCKKYGEPRRTSIADADVQAEMSMEELVADEEALVVFSTGGRIKRLPVSVFPTRRRGGRGMTAGDLKEDDSMGTILPVRAHDTLVCVATDGACYHLRAFDVPERSRTAHGAPIAELLPKMKDSSTIAAILPLRKKDNRSLLLATRLGDAKRLALSTLQTMRQGTSIMGLKAGDELRFTATCKDSDVVMLACTSGKVATFPVTQLRLASRTAGGVRAKRLPAGNEVVGICVVDKDRFMAATKENGPWAMLASSMGLGKRVVLSEFPVGKRGAMGVQGLLLKEDSQLVSLHIVDQEGSTVEDCFAVTRAGLLSKIPLGDLQVYGRYARGLRILRLRDQDQLLSLSPCQFRQYSTSK